MPPPLRHVYHFAFLLVALDHAHLCRSRLQAREHALPPVPRACGDQFLVVALPLRSLRALLALTPLLAPLLLALGLDPELDGGHRRREKDPSFPPVK